MKLRIGDLAPDFTLPSHLEDKSVTLNHLRGKNTVLVFYPAAFTPVWTAQIPSYEAQKAQFAGLNAQVLGISTDPVPSIKAWAESLGGITYPLLSDFWPHGAVSEKYGVLRPEGTSERAIFVVDKFGFIRYANIYDIDTQPENEDIFTVLRRLEPQLAVRPVVTSDQPAEPLPHGGIVMYCTSWCPECRRARAWMKARSLDFVEIDIDTNPAAAIQVKKWANGTRTTPLFDIDGTIIIRFDESKLQEALKDRIQTP